MDLVVYKNRLSNASKAWLDSSKTLSCSLAAGQLCMADSEIVFSWQRESGQFQAAATESWPTLRSFTLPFRLETTYKKPLLIYLTCCKFWVCVWAIEEWALKPCLASEFSLHPTWGHWTSDQPITEYGHKTVWMCWSGVVGMTQCALLSRQSGLCGL